MPNILLSSLDLSPRAIHCLESVNIYYLNQLLEATDVYLHSIRGIGQKTLEEIYELKLSVQNENLPLKYPIPLEEPYSQKEFLVINLAFPEQSYIDNSKLLFKTKKGFLLDNAPLTDFDLPIRCINAFNRIDIYSIKEVCLYPFKTLKDIPCLGQGTIDKLLSYLSQITVIESKPLEIPDAQTAEYHVFCEQLLQKFKANGIDSTYETLKLELNSFISKGLENNHPNNPEEFEKLFKEYIKSSREVENKLTKLIFNIVSNVSELISREEIKLKLPNILNDDELIDKSLQLLLNDKSIEFYETGYRIYRPYFKDWVKNLKKGQREALIYRVQGKTLQECGDIMNNISRERVRQLVNSALLKKPLLKEDEYKYWYTKYNLTYEGMDSIFRISLDDYNFLHMLYDRGTFPLNEMLNDEKITPELQPRLLKYLNRNKIIINGEYILLNRHSLCRALAREICAEKAVDVSYFYQKYMELLEKNNLTNNSGLLFANERAFEARVQNSMYLLMSLWHRVRYYPFNEYDVLEFVKELHLEQFKDIEISSYKLILNNPRLIEQFNIQNEYELHNFLNKTQNQWNKNNQYNVTMGRMPTISFGNANREKQTIELLKQLSPISSKEFGQFYEAEFGVHTASVLANMYPYIEQYYHSGKYEIEQQLLPPEEENFLRGKLTDSFYYIAEVEELFAREFGSEAVSKLNSRCYRCLGFRVYSHCILKNTFRGANDYFSSLIANNNGALISKLMQHCTKNNVLFYKILNDSLEKLDILECSYKEYLTFDQYNLINPKASKESLMNFINNVYELSSIDFFTIDSLLQQQSILNTLSEDLEVQANSFFFIALLKNSHKFKYIRAANSYVFYNREATTKSTLDFIKFVLKSLVRISIDDFIYYLHTQYGIAIYRSKILSLIADSDIYFDRFANILYYSLDDYCLFNNA